MKTKKLILTALLLCGPLTAAPVQKWTFKTKPVKKMYALGLRKPAVAQNFALDQSFKMADVQIPAHFDLRDVSDLSPVLDQGQCGSCVYHSVTSNFADSWLLRGKDLTGDKNFMSVEYLMTNPVDQGGKCNGSYFMATAPVTQKGLAAGKDCAYNYGQRGCASGIQVYGPTQSVRLIDPSPKSIATALVQRYPVSNTIGANGTFQSYNGGIYNACRNVGTNHETEIVGIDCESATGDAGKFCAFDANGKLPPGVGYWIVRNSWSTSWGEKGFYRIKMTDANGNLCNNVAEEVGVIETGVPVPAPVPPTPPAPVPPPAPAPSPNSGGKIALFVFLILGAISGIVSLVLRVAKK